MSHELSGPDYARVRALFRSLAAFQPLCAAVLAGVQQGRVYVDDPQQPSTALVRTYLRSDRELAWMFLAGDPHNEAFNRALNRGIRRRTIIGDRTPGILFTCDPQDWAGQLGAVCEPHELTAVWRRHYVCRRTAFDWRAAVPDGFDIRPLDESLQALEAELPYEVRATLQKWQAAGQGLDDYGFAAVERDSGVVASWTTVDFCLDGQGDAGLYTEDAYRGRGLALVTAAAALEHGLTHGLNTIHWTCDAENPGSIRLAEKLGLERQADYVSYYVVC